LSAKVSLNILNVDFDRDEKDIKRAVSKIAWHPEGVSKIAVGYAIQRFQQMPEKMPNEAYIWDINNPNSPISILESPSPVTCLKFNQKSVGVIAGGTYSGLVL
jgi:WD40 repeat protein